MSKNAKTDEELHVVDQGACDTPALLLIHGSAGSTAWWQQVAPTLTERFRVIRVDLLGHGKSPSPRASYDIPAHARRVRSELERLGIDRAVVVGHSMGCLVATAIAEQGTGSVAGLVLIDMGPTLDAAPSDPLPVRLLLTRVPGALLWRLRSDTSIRRALRSATARTIEIPTDIVDSTLAMTHRSLAKTSRGAKRYLNEQGLPDRLRTLRVPSLVIFGEDDARYPSSSVVAYRSVPDTRIEILPGVGHSPMLEDPCATTALLAGFARTAFERPVTGRVR